MDGDKAQQVVSPPKQEAVELAGLQHESADRIKSIAYKAHWLARTELQYLTMPKNQRSAEMCP